MTMTRAVCILLIVILILLYEGGYGDPDDALIYGFGMGGIWGFAMFSKHV